MRKVSTGFAADDMIAKSVIESVLGQLSDGIWENSQAMNKYWLALSNEKTDLAVSENMFEKFCGKRYLNPFLNLPEDEIKKWFATKLKQVVKHEEKDSGGKNWWKRDNNNIVLDYLSGYYKDDEGVLQKHEVTVADAYRVYDKLLGRNRN